MGNVMVAHGRLFLSKEPRKARALRGPESTLVLSGKAGLSKKKDSGGRINGPLF